MRRFSGRVSALLLAVALAACGDRGWEGGSAVSAADTVRVRDDAVNIVGTSELISRVRDVVPLEDGRTWVLNSVPPYFLAFGVDGRVEQSFGDQGEGPSEFGSPVRLVGDADQGVWVYDARRNSLVRVSTEDRAVRRLPGDSLPMLRLLSFQNAGIRPGPPWLEMADGTMLVSRTSEPVTEAGAYRLWSGEIYRLDLSDDEVGYSPALPPLRGILTPRADRFGDATLFLPYPLWAACPDATFVVYDPGANVVHRTGADPTTTVDRAILPALPEERGVALTLERMAGLIFRAIDEEVPVGTAADSVDIHAEVAQEFPQMAMRSADVFPEYADLRCAPDGTVWIQPFDTERGVYGRGPTWLRTEPGGGAPWSPVTFPDRFVPYAFDTERIWGTSLDALDVASVAWVETTEVR